MSKITAYLMAPCRGRDGDSVSPEEKLENVRKAIEIGNALRAAFPCLDLFVPHEHEEVIDWLWRDGLSSEAIVNATSKVAVSKDISFVYDGNGISEGMSREIDAVSQAGRPIVYFDILDEETREQIALVINELRANDKEIAKITVLRNIKVMGAQPENLEVLCRPFV